MEWYLTLLAVYRNKNKKEVLFNTINPEGLKTNSCSSNQTSRGSVRSLRSTETKSSTQFVEKRTRDASADPGFVSMGKTKTKRDKNHEKNKKTCQVI